MTAEMLAAALEAAENDWAVFPCCESGKAAKAPYTAHGHHDATTDPGQIRRWWYRWPNAMIGALVPRGCVVFDVDPRNGGTAEALTEAVGPLPPTLTTWSGRGDGGRHLYFRIPLDPPPLSSARLPVGVDLKTGGKGYCILPPSIHPATGVPYRWKVHDTAWLPGKALDVILATAHEPRQRLRVIQGGSPLVRAVESAPPRKRNDMLFWAACRAAESGMLEGLWTDLAGAARSAGLSDAEIKRTLASAERTAGVPA